MIQYNINDFVIYMSKKIYKITNIEAKNFGNGEKNFYVLADENNKSDTLYLPMDNELVLKKIRHLLTKEQIDKAIDESFIINPPWINQYKDRAVFYEKLLKENNMSKLLAQINLISIKKKELEEKKKSLLNVDLTFFNNIIQIISEEFSYVLKLENNEILDYILKRKLS